MRFDKYKNDKIEERIYSEAEKQAMLDKIEQKSVKSLEKGKRQAYTVFILIIVFALLKLTDFATLQGTNLAVPSLIGAAIQLVLAFFFLKGNSGVKVALIFMLGQGLVAIIPQFITILVTPQYYDIPLTFLLLLLLYGSQLAAQVYMLTVLIKSHELAEWLYNRR